MSFSGLKPKRVDYKLYIISNQTKNVEKTHLNFFTHFQYCIFIVIMAPKILKDGIHVVAVT